MRVTGISTILTAQLFIYGCYLPSPIAQTPEIRGTVIDNSSKRPIEDVLTYYKQYPHSVSRTDPNGQFSLRENSRWRLVSIGAKSVPTTFGILVLEGQMYEKKEVEISGKGGWPVEMTIELSRQE